MSVVAAAEAKQLAVLQGEVDGLACKLNGYERALQDCEVEVRSSPPLCSTAAMEQQQPSCILRQQGWPLLPLYDLS
jgi:hypothetical protein